MGIIALCIGLMYYDELLQVLASSTSHNGWLSPGIEKQRNIFLLKLLHFITTPRTKQRHHIAITPLLYHVHILFYRLVWELTRLAARWGYWWLSPSHSGCLEMANTIEASQRGRNSQPRILCPKCEISPARGSYHLVLGVKQEQWQCLVLF